MSHFCIVAPVHILGALKQRGVMWRHHLLLAHDVVQHREAYREVFKEIHPHPFSFVIMDNSVIETGVALDTKMIQEACQTIRPSCVVLPDVLEDAYSTIHSCSDAAHYWSTLPGLRDIPFMYAPQGKTLREFSSAAEALAYDRRIRYWAVPRNLVKNIGTRKEAIQVLKVLSPDRPIHLLGFSDNIIDDILCARMPEVGSIDSAVPLRYAGSLSLSTTLQPRGEWWLKGTVNEHTITNLNKVRSWCNGGDYIHAAA